MRNERGASAIEYALLVAFLCVGIIPAASAVSQKSSEKLFWFSRAISQGVGTESSQECEGFCPETLLNGGSGGGSGPGSGSGNGSEQGGNGIGNGQGSSGSGSSGGSGSGSGGGFGGFGG